SLAGNGGAVTLLAALNLNGGTVRAASITNGGGAGAINLNSGTLDCQGGQIANVTTLNIGASGATDLAQLTGAAAISSPNPITIAPNGLLAGNSLITSPRLVVNGMISPGGPDVGSLTTSGPVTLGPGGWYTWDIQDAFGTPGVA